MGEVWLTPWLQMSCKTECHSLRKPKEARPYGGEKPCSQRILLMILHPPRGHQSTKEKRKSQEMCVVVGGEHTLLDRFGVLH